MRNRLPSPRTVADIDGQIAKVIRGLGHPEPPLQLHSVRELLKLDRSYYSTTDDGLLREMFSRLKVGAKQVLARPTILRDAISSLNLKALYLPDEKRILLDQDVPQLKHRWNEAHEIGHDIIPWHAGMMWGDTEQTLTPSCHEEMEAEANYAAGRLLFLADRFEGEAEAMEIGLTQVRALAVAFGNTVTSTLWRYVEQAHRGRPMAALVTGHQHPSKSKTGFDPKDPCRYYVRSPEFARRFGNVLHTALFARVVEYCGSQRGGTLGSNDIVLADANGETHLFRFETFYNGYEALTLGVWLRRHEVVVAFRC